MSLEPSYLRSRGWPPPSLARREAEVAALHGMGPNGVRVLRDALAAHGPAFRA